MKHDVQCKHPKLPLILNEFSAAQNKASRANQDLMNAIGAGIHGLVEIVETDADLGLYIIGYIRHRLQASAAKRYSTLPMPILATVSTAQPATGTWPMCSGKVTDGTKCSKSNASNPTTFMLRGVPLFWDLGRLRQELCTVGLVEGRDVDCICLVQDGSDRRDHKVSSTVAAPMSKKQNKGYAFVNVTLPAKGEFLQKAFLSHTDALTVRVAKNQGIQYYRKHHCCDSVFFRNSQGNKTCVPDLPVLSTLPSHSQTQDKFLAAALPAAHGDTTGAAIDGATNLELLQILQQQEDGTTCQASSDGYNNLCENLMAVQPQPNQDNLIATALLAYLQESDT